MRTFGLESRAAPWLELSSKIARTLLHAFELYARLTVLSLWSVLWSVFVAGPPLHVPSLHVPNPPQLGRSTSVENLRMCALYKMVKSRSTQRALWTCT